MNMKRGIVLAVCLGLILALCTGGAATAETQRRERKLDTLATPAPAATPEDQPAETMPAMEITPLDEMEDMFYQRTLGQSGIPVLLPVRAQAEVAVDEPEATIMFVFDPSMPEVIFCYFAILAPEYEGADLRALATEEEMVAFLSWMSAYPEEAAYELREDFVEGVDAVFVRESKPADSAHLVTMVGDRMLVLTMMRQEGEGALTDAQVEHLAWMYTHGLQGVLMEQPLTVVQFPGDGPSFALAEGMGFRPMEMEDAYISGSLTDPGDPDKTSLVLIAYRDDVLAGQSISGMDEAMRAEVGARLAISGEGMEAQTFTLAEGFAEGAGMMSDLNGSIRTTIGVKDGWAVSLLCFELPGKDIEAEHALQDALLEAFLLGNDSL